mgnify:CR=1
METAREERIKQYNKDYYVQNKKYIRRRRILSSMLYPLAYIGYRALKNKHGEVTFDIVSKYVQCSRISVDKAIQFFEEQEKTEDINL